MDRDKSYYLILILCVQDTVMVKVTNSSPHPLTTALQHLFHDVNTNKGSLSPYDVLTALGRE